MRKTVSFAVSGAVLVVLAAATAFAAPAWVMLGERNVTDRLDHDVIAVGADRGEFTSVKVIVRRHAVDFHRFVIHFGNGAQQVIELRRTIPAGGESRTVDLEGGRRVIRSIEFWYDAHTLGGRTATVEALGLR
jgi:hypothetical protein